jgi:hypothetical protein
MLKKPCCLHGFFSPKLTSVEMPMPETSRFSLKTFGMALLVLLLCGLLSCSQLAAAVKSGPKANVPRKVAAQEAPAKMLLYNGQWLLQPLASVPDFHLKPWSLEGRSLTNTERSPADVLAIRRSSSWAGEAWYEGDVEITEGDVAGLVVRANTDGSSCYAVLLGAQSQTVRIITLPWPGHDLQTVSAAIQHHQTYHLGIRCGAGKPGFLEIEAYLDGQKVAEYTGRAHSPVAEGHFGVLVNNSKARFGNLAAWPGGARGGGKPLFQDDFAQTPLETYLETDPSSASAVPFPVSIQDDLLTFHARLPAHGTGMGAVARLRHNVTNPRRIWLPHLAPAPSYVIGDHAFRSPAILLANDKVALALIPDVEDVAAIHRAGLRVWLDYDNPTRTITVAAGNYRVGGFHVAYQAAPAAYAGQSVTLRLHILTSSRPADLAAPYGLAARWMWQRWGHPRHVQGGSQHAPLTRYAGYVAHWAFTPEPNGWKETVWQEFQIGARRCGAPAFIVDAAQHPSVPRSQRRWREQKSVWNQLWFSTQRCANGLLRYARQTGSQDLEKRAFAMTQVALAAPQTNGLFPAVYTAGGGGYRLETETPGWKDARWTNSDRRPPGVSPEACHLLDAAYTARLLLQWHDLVPGETETVPYVRRFAARLCALQRPSGAFPGWVEPDGRIPPALAEGPESAMGATLLLELSDRFPREAQYRSAAVRALRYLEADPVRRSRWEDFETYFSCSRWGDDHLGRVVSRNGVYKSNSLSPFWCAEAFLAGFRTLGDPHLLALGRRCLDELSLYQQVWDPPWIPASCHGGFGVMNGDGEWDDARQSLFAPLYLEYYVATGRHEYFERGVAALRASFAMLYCPENVQVRHAYELAHPNFGPESYGFMMENIAHGGPGTDVIGPFTIFTWGNGAALATETAIRDRFGDLYVDTFRHTAFGIDGCGAEVQAGMVHIHDRYKRPALLVRYGNGASRKIILNDGKGTVPLKP